MEGAPPQEGGWVNDDPTQSLPFEDAGEGGEGGAFAEGAAQADGSGARHGGFGDVGEAPPRHGGWDRGGDFQRQGPAGFRERPAPPPLEMMQEPGLLEL
ncbi:MAG TPA: hypothetical protein VEI02_09900, partial [Planctomycetota bacterium]|nr:hypothetical protein [Planctomycetota bacterium]